MIVAVASPPLGMVPSRHRMMLLEVMIAPCETVEETIEAEEGIKFVNVTPVAVLGP